MEIRMGIINVLPNEISNKIAAGEVVERPASVVKELVENSIDAGSTVIGVEIKKGGVTYIRVSDNGKGMSREDAEIAFLRHATSKIHTADDLDAIYTLGFRGEALSSIGAVSQSEMFTKRREDEAGSHISCIGGEITSSREDGMPDGTTFEVRNLFFNTPARMNFLKRDATEAAAITDIMERFILSHPEISFRYVVDGKEKYFTAGDNNLAGSIYAVYGKSYVNSVIPVDYRTELVTISGMIGKGDAARPNRNYQSFFVNRRYVKSMRLSNTAEAAYKNQIMINKHPMLVLNIEIDPKLTNVNVHPTKLEVKFSHDEEVFRALFHAVENALYAIPNVPKIERREAPSEFIRDKSDTAEQIAFPSAETQRAEPSKAPETKTVTEPSPNNIPAAAKPQSTRPTADDIKVKPFTSYALDMDKDYFRRKRAEMVGGESSQGKDDTLSEVGENIKVKILTSKESGTMFKPTPEEKPKENKGWDFDRAALRIVGQLFDTYIIAQSNDTIILADQHAAHERLKYEELKKELAEHKVTSQMLLVPVAVDVSSGEHAVFTENAARFAELGFEIEEFGDNSLIIRATPEPLDEEDLKQLVLEIIDKMAKGSRDLISDKMERALYTIACKAAIKANHKYDNKQLESLLNAVLDLGNINTCPHGRPIIITMTKKELEREFKRII
ncbi:MAG: DNA mismatch repair endonuclease MutL [Clostridiales bacterium]|nr:DNA mismatch repair endonuclease MutL [Clostridiales bacterium]